MIFEKQIMDIYMGMAYTRCDDNGTAFYFSADDFAGLNAEPYSFASSMGHLLNGYLYYYDNVKEGRLIILDHGFGGGHRSYMKEIEVLCKQGYLVLAYDHTGCMTSGGNTPNGMAQSLCDLNDCVESVRDDDRFEGMTISVIGHSWGGFSTLNISALHPEISHIVVFSGFVSVEKLINAYFSGLLKPYQKLILDLENRSNPEFVQYNAIESLKNSSAKALLIYSDNDQLCSKKVHYDALVSALSDRDNTEFILESKKGHNPNYTHDAVAYLSEYLKAKNKLTKQKKLVTDEQKKAFIDSFDWNRMTAQDMGVWERIFKHLEG